ncbi:MAG: porphobilinogen synthase [Candidatus Omnitrophica bacterium]|nr:porphobilinogen synthase [Candidatus Omnitrophota bacterium]
MEFNRLRRYRVNETIRNMFAETRLSVKDVILPFFVIEGKNKKEPIPSMPGIYRLSKDLLVREIKDVKKYGINTFLLFGIPGKKDGTGTGAYSKNGIIRETALEIKEKVEDVVIITDVCLCGYTTHGHCGIVKKEKDGQFYIDNDETIKILAEIAVSHAESGVDFVAPSAMMDGQVKKIRESLDGNGFYNTRIMGYSAKYASGFYGPFRDALDSSPQFGDRKTYQMDYRNLEQAMKEIEEDIKEGADIIMVKPALSYLDVIKTASEKYKFPLAAYNVSGEYGMIKSACRQGLFKEKDVVLEILTSIKRAGADFIITYFAREAAKWLQD